MIFCYGPIKIMLSFEHQDEYILDLTHFGSTPGIFLKEELREKAIIKLGDMQKDFTSAFYFAEEKTKILQDWLKTCLDEFSVFIGPAISPSIVRMISFTDELLLEITTRRDSILKEVFGVERQASMIIEEEVLPERGRFLDRVHTEMQANRIHALIGKRVSELIFLLRKIHVLVIHKFLPKVYGNKRSPFVIHQENTQRIIHDKTNHLSLDESQTRYNTGIDKANHMSMALRANETKQSFHTKQDPLLATTSKVNLDEKTEQEGLLGPSKRLKDNYLEIAEFES